MKGDSIVDLEKRVSVLEKQVKELCRHIGKSTTAPRENGEKENDDDYCCIS